VSLICPHCGKGFALMAVADDAKPRPAVVTGMHTDGTWTCPVHQKGRIVPAGVSKRTGKPYNTFWACSEPGCNEKGIYSGPPPMAPPPVQPTPMDMAPDELVPF